MKIKLNIGPDMSLNPKKWEKFEYPLEIPLLKQIIFN